MDSVLINGGIQILVGVVIVPYLVYNHRRVDKLENKTDVQEIKVDNLKEDLKEIKEGIQKLIDRELNKGRK